jgi:hypothetical protein
MSGEVGILNVGAGDTKLTFDNKNPAETLRASRIVKDMLRRGYALLIEVEQPDGSKSYQRALDFDEARAEYVIADFDPSYSQEPRTPEPPQYVPPPRYGAEPTTETIGEEASEAPSGAAPESAAEAPAPRAPARGRPRGTKRIPASSTRAVAVARSAGG